MHSLVHEHYLRAEHAERLAPRGPRRGWRRWRHLPPNPPPPRPPRRGGGAYAPPLPLSAAARRPALSGSWEGR
jgi:hypothetical protein